MANSLIIGALAISPASLWKNKWAAFAMLSAGLLISAAWVGIAVQGWSAIRGHADIAGTYASASFKHVPNPFADFPASRPAFLRAWIASPGHVGRALLRDGRLAAWGVIRPCRTGCKIGPLLADDRADAEAVLTALLAGVGGGEIFLDVPSVNRDAVALPQDLRLELVFKTARMSGAIPPLCLERVFGVTTFELG